MKKLLTILGAILLASTIYAQVPEKMSYQAAIRNSSNQLVANQQVGTRISILQGAPTGVVVYVETQTPSTNANGLVSIEIGAGVVVDGNFTSIDWESGPYFIKTETDPKGGTNYTITGTSQLLSVPYALHAKTAEMVTGTVAETDPTYSATFSIANPQQGDLLSYNATTNKWEQYTPDYATESHVHNFATNKANGFMSAADKAKLDGLKSGNILSIGQEHQGGIIFWLDATGQHGLIAATTDQSIGIQWHNGTSKFTGTSDGLYAGAMNTAMIVATQMSDNQTGNFAAKVCADYSVTVNGVTYGDWYLPSKYELNLLHLQKTAVGGFASAAYWSSTEYSNRSAVTKYFRDDGTQINGYKDSAFYVRAVRAF